MKNKTWSVSDISKEIKIRSNDLEFQDNKEEWHHFVIVVTPEKVVFGGCCNVGFLESGYITREEFEDLDDTISELINDLETFYNVGPQYTNRIVFNERM